MKTRFSSFVGRPFMGRLTAAATATIVTLSACGGSAPAPAAAPPAATPAPSAATAPAAAAATITLMEPAEGSFAGHVDNFRWSPVSGADSYHVKISTAAGRVVWESPTLTSADVHLPGTVSLEPEAHVWQVTAMKGTAVLIASSVGRFTVTP